MPNIPCSLLIDPPTSGDWNMAVDEALLDFFSEHGGCCLRFYGWAEPTLSLGYFQAYDDRAQHPASLACPVVRRASGGGAIVHDVELTYSLVVAESHLAEQREKLYRMVHATLIDTLAILGVSGASLFGDRPNLRQPKQAFLCFERRSAGDVIYGEVKIAGSAQRRRRGAVLQHGSVLLGRSAAAPELPGIGELAAQELACDTLIDAWSERLAAGLGLAFSPYTISDALQQLAKRYVETKHASSAWVRERNWRENG